MASFFSSAGEDIETRIARLSKELSSLRKAAAKRGAQSYEDGLELASDTYDEWRDRFEEALPRIRKGARRIERSARDNPAATALVGLAALGLLALLLSRR